VKFEDALEQTDEAVYGLYQDMNDDQKTLVAELLILSAISDGTRNIEKAENVDELFECLNVPYEVYVAAH